MIRGIVGRFTHFGNGLVSQLEKKIVFVFKDEDDAEHLFREIVSNGLIPEVKYSVDVHNSSQFFGCVYLSPHANIHGVVDCLRRILSATEIRLLRFDGMEIQKIENGFVCEKGE